MNSTPLVVGQSQTTVHSGMIGGVMYTGTSTTSLPPTVIPAHPPKTQVMDEGALDISVDLRKKQKQLIVEGKTITIESASDDKVVYSISD